MAGASPRKSKGFIANSAKLRFPAETAGVVAAADGLASFCSIFPQPEK
jgi:hypothetical protein